MAIITYKRGSNAQLTTNFKYREFDCKCGKCAETKHDTALSAGMQTMREFFGKPIHNTSPYRCPTHNANSGGGKNSYHMKGMACDFYIPGVNLSEICKIAESIGFNGIGIYPDDGFVHVDTRPASEKFFWQGHEEIPVKTFGGTPGMFDPKPENRADKLAAAIKAVLEDFGY